MKTYLSMAMLLCFFFSCKKNENEAEVKDLHTYTVTLENAAVKDARCGIDLAAGKVYTIAEGVGQQEQVDIAYGYMAQANSSYERCFLSISYAGCWCGGSSYFSYGDQIGSDGTRKGYSSYSIQNKTKILKAKATMDFDKIFAAGKKADLDLAFPTMSSGTSNDATFFSLKDNLVQYPYIFFETVKGKKGIIRIKGYVKNTGTNYQLQKNAIIIDVVVER